MESYVHPCGTAVEIKAGTVIEVELVKDSALDSYSPPPPLLSAGKVVLTGTVYETTGAGRQPIAGAEVFASDNVDMQN